MRSAVEHTRTGGWPEQMLYHVFALREMLWKKVMKGK